MSERLRTMTDGEIVTSYRQAKDKREQIGILADLNLMTKEKVCEILRAAGINEVGEAKKVRREPPNVWRDEELDSLRRMCAEGRGLGEISASLGRTRHAVHRKGVSLGLAFCEDVLPGEDVGKKRSNKMWTTGELDSLRRMAARGKDCRGMCRSARADEDRRDGQGVHAEDSLGAVERSRAGCAAREACVERVDTGRGPRRFGDCAPRESLRRNAPKRSDGRRTPCTCVRRRSGFPSGVHMRR